MPTRARRYQPAHKRKKWNGKTLARPHIHLYDARWNRASKTFLTSNPWCANCLAFGMHVLSEETDHIRPHKGDTAVFWDLSNWQPLSKRCHSQKTRREQQGMVIDWVPLEGRVVLSGIGQRIESAKRAYEQAKAERAMWFHLGQS